jgi:hypothetical protein
VGVDEAEGERHARRDRCSRDHHDGAAAAGAGHRAASDGMQQRDPDRIRRSPAILWPLVAAWFRPEIGMLGRIPVSGPVLPVGNHSGGNVAPDTLVLTLAFYRRFDAERSFFQPAHHPVMRAPLLSLLRRYGTIAASWAAARAALDLAADVPTVPVVSNRGPGDDAVSNSRSALSADAEARPARSPRVLPVSLALPWGLDVGDLSGHIPLPAKITIQVLDPIDLRDRYGPDPDVHAVYRSITGLMQRSLDELAAHLRWWVIG